MDGRQTQERVEMSAVLKLLKTCLCHDIITLFVQRQADLPDSQPAKQRSSSC